MTRKVWNTSFSMMTMLGGSLAALACGQANITDPANATDDTSVDQALTAVRNCQERAKACVGDGAATANCDDELRQCLIAAHSKGAQPSDVAVDAAAKPGHAPDEDGATHESVGTEEDAADHRGGREIEQSDAAHHEHVNIADGGETALQLCIDDLKSCLGSASRPGDCAEAAVKCLSPFRGSHK